MDAKIIFCYLYFFSRGGPLKSAIGEAVDAHGQSNYWVGVEILHKAYKLEISDTNEFLNKYLTGDQDDK